MSYYRDLSPYAYTYAPEPMVNIGWLDRAHEFDAGEPDGRLVAALVELAMRPANMMRGLHDCPFCGLQSPVEVTSPVEPGHTARLGNGEIHVRGPQGVTYSAPTLIAHYVSAHRYLPPQEFVDAAIAAAAVGHVG